MSSRHRASAFAVLALAALPVLAACDTSPGAAAVIGSHRISTGQLQTQVRESLAAGQVQSQQGFTTTGFTRGLLDHMISVDVLNSLAAQQHVSVTSAEISAKQASYVQQAGSLATLQQQAATQGITAAQLPGFIRFGALEDKVGVSLTASLTATQAQLKAEYQKDIDTYDQLDIAQIAVTKKALAHRILQKVRQDPTKFAALAEQYSADTTSKAKGGEVGFVGRSQVAALFPNSTPTLRPGTFVLAKASSEYVVLHIISRKTQPLSTVTAQVRTALFASQATSLLQKALVTQSAKLGVHISPRYGKWDPTTQAVVATTSPISSAG